MAPRSNQDRLKIGAAAAGAFALGATGVAGAGNQIDSGDIENGSIKLKDLTAGTKTALSEHSLLASKVSALWGAAQFVAPGSDALSPIETTVQALVPPVPAGGFRARGLAVRSVDGKGAAFGQVAVQLRVNGVGTLLNCTVIAATNSCDDTANIAVTPGDSLALAVTNSNVTKQAANVTIALSLTS